MLASAEYRAIQLLKQYFEPIPDVYLSPLPSWESWKVGSLVCSQQRVLTSQWHDWAIFNASTVQNNAMKIAVENIADDVATQVDLSSTTVPVVLGNPIVKVGAITGVTSGLVRGTCPDVDSRIPGNRQKSSILLS